MARKKTRKQKRQSAFRRVLGLGLGAAAIKGALGAAGAFAVKKLTERI